MANKTYPNAVLANKFADQYASKLDLMQFCTVDSSLQGVPGDKVIINTYTATDGTEQLTLGQGNTKDIEVTYTPEEYEIILLQNRFTYYDEEERRDPKVVDKGIEHGVTDMYNTANALAMAEFTKATLEAETSAYDFNAFVDGLALFNNENEEIEVFALVHKDNKAELRKNLKDDLKYVDDYARHGYLGTVAGVNLYVSNIATKDSIILATKKAVTYFDKVGAEVETDREADTRRNRVFNRKCGIFAFTDATQAVKLVKTGA